eukprot:763293-Hanusia_phi.AAC.5
MSSSSGRKAPPPRRDRSFSRCPWLSASFLVESSLSACPQAKLLADRLPPWTVGYPGPLPPASGPATARPRCTWGDWRPTPAA